MSEFKGTKGPWNFSFHGSENCWVTDSENDKAIAKVTNYGKDALQQKANFHLIAAAPDLLAALQYIVDPLINDLPIHSMAYKQAVAAIAKALGETK